MQLWQIGGTSKAARRGGQAAEIFEQTLKELAGEAHAD
jgi:hypothetical protein